MNSTNTGRWIAAALTVAILVVAVWTIGARYAEPRYEATRCVEERRGQLACGVLDRRTGEIRWQRSG